MSAADELRAAATKLRGLAEAATDPPWSYTDEDDEPIAENVLPADARYIDAMHPGVALALADWLDDEAVGAQTETGEPTAHSLAVARAINGGAA